MKILNGIKQGSDQWHEIRGKYRTASEAPAMMGHGQITRNELLAAKAEGAQKEHSQYVEEVIFARGHEVEALARPIAEKLLGEDLYPMTGVCDDDYLLASFDGITMDESVVWENKQWNESKAEMVRNQQCPEGDYWQIVHQVAVSGAEKALYTVSDGTDNGTVALEIIVPTEDIQKLLASWRQFDEDVANYQPREPEPEVVGRAPDQLPALRIEVKGTVTASNLEAFRDHAMAVFQGINTELSTDADFANAEKTVKWCKDVETKLDGAKEQALAQTASIDDLFRAIDSIKEESRATRLTLERSVNSRKDQIRREIITQAREALQVHVQKINTALDVPIPAPSADFAGAIKGKRTISSLRNATDTLLSQSKIQANELADLVRANLKTLDDAGHAHLFSDRAQLALRDTDYVKGIVSTRIIEREQAEARRLAAERERIRAEEEAKARRAAEEQRQADLRAEESQAKVAAAEANPPKARPKQSKAHQPQTISVKHPAKQSRPSDTDMLGVLADYYRVHESKAHEWVLSMDHKAIEKWIRDEFVA